MAFGLELAVPADIEAMVQIWYFSFRSYDIWLAAMRNVTPEDEKAFYTKALTKRFEKPNRGFMKIVERETK